MLTPISLIYPLPPSETYHAITPHHDHYIDYISHHTTTTIKIMIPLLFVSFVSFFGFGFKDFEYDEDTETYSYPCPCGDIFKITLVRARVVTITTGVLTHLHIAHARDRARACVCLYGCLLHAPRK